LINVCRHSQKTWYQANWFTINVENLEALWNNICPPQQIDVTILEKSTCSEKTDDIKDFLSKDFPSQEAAESEKSLEPDPDLVKQQVTVQEAPKLTGEPTSPEQPTVTHSVDDNSQDFSTNDLISRVDASPVPSDEKDSLTNDLISRVDASPVPSDENEELQMKLCEVRDAVGKLTSDLKRLVVTAIFR
jgi:hypothetical protein